MRRLHRWVYDLHPLAGGIVAAGLVWGIVAARNPFNCLFCALLVYWTMFSFAEPR